jgi:hypothetical protein
MNVVRTLSICILFLWQVATAGALNPDRDIHQLAHRSWAKRIDIPAMRRLWHKPQMDSCG